jgi:hypothetical protein
MTHTTASSRNSRPRLAQRRSLELIVSLACTSLACATRDLDERDLGSTAPPLISNDSAEPGERLPVVQPDGWVDSFVEGHWVGRAENLFAPSGANGERPAYAFPSGSTDFTLDISLAVPTSPRGQIVFGSGAIPEPERGVAYPPGVSARTSGITLEPFLPPQEGRAYALLEQIMRFAADSGVAAGALALSFPSNGAYVEWCALQLPRPTGDGRYDCLSFSTPDDEQASCAIVQENGVASKFDCDLGALCGAPNVCQCNENDCQVAEGAYSHVWLIRDGDDLLGTFVGAVFDHGNSGRPLPVGSVRFTRVNP